MLKRAALLIVLVAGGFLAGMVVMGRTQGASSEAIPEPVAPTAATPQRPGGPLPQNLPDFSAVAARTVDSVVNVASIQIVRAPMSPFATDPFFRYFFGDDPDMFGSPSRREASRGSAVIVSADGYVVTNNHVVGSEVEEVNIALGDRRELRATVVGTDRLTDIALLKVEATGLPVVPWSDSASLKVGEWVLAIGSPFQLSQTVTLGIVSAVGRANIGFTDYEDFIQTDAAINPGNSGGALVNARGELVGINTGILSRTGGYQGIGFAIPSNLARRVIDDLRQFGAVRRGSIGSLEIAPLTTQLARDLGLDSTKGALVWRMERSSQAYRDGVRPGDVVVAVDGTPIEDASHFLRVIADSAIGRAVRLTVVRDGRRQDIEVSVVRGSSR